MTSLNHRLSSCPMHAWSGDACKGASVDQVARRRGSIWWEKGDRSGQESEAIARDRRMTTQLQYSTKASISYDTQLGRIRSINPPNACRTGSEEIHIHWATIAWQGNTITFFHRSISSSNQCRFGLRTFRDSKAKKGMYTPMLNLTIGSNFLTNGSFVQVIIWKVGRLEPALASDRALSLAFFV